MNLKTTIEDIILENDKREISKLRPLLEKNYCEQAAELIVSNPKTAIITTGFFITGPDKPETDEAAGTTGVAGINLDAVCVAGLCDLCSEPVSKLAICC